MADNDLQKLKRHEVLQLLLDQSEETEQLRVQLAETQEQLRQLEETYERLRKRLDKKDMQIHGLRDMLTEQRDKREIQLAEAGSIAEAALRLNGIFEAAQKAADQYLYNIELLKEGKLSLEEEEYEWEKHLDEEEEPFPPAEVIKEAAIAAPKAEEPAGEAQAAADEPEQAEEPGEPEAEGSVEPEIQETEEPSWGADLEEGAEAGWDDLNEPGEPEAEEPQEAKAKEPAKEESQETEPEPERKGFWARRKSKNKHTGGSA